MDGPHGIVFKEIVGKNRWTGNIIIKDIIIPNYIFRSQEAYPDTCKDKFGGLIYSKKRGVGPRCEQRVFAIKEAIERNIKVLMDYQHPKFDGYLTNQRKIAYFKNIEVKPIDIVEDNGDYYIIATEDNYPEIISFNQVFYLNLLYPEDIQDRIKIPDPFFVKHEFINGIEYISLHYFLSTYDLDETSIILYDFNSNQENKIDNPSQEVVMLCNDLLKKDIHAGEKTLLKLIRKDILFENPNLKKDISIKIKFSASEFSNVCYFNHIPNNGVYFHTCCSDINIEELFNFQNINDYYNAKKPKAESFPNKNKANNERWTAERTVLSTLGSIDKEKILMTVNSFITQENTSYLKKILGFPINFNIFQGILNDNDYINISLKLLEKAISIIPDQSTIPEKIPENCQQMHLKSFHNKKRIVFKENITIDYSSGLMWQSFGDNGSITCKPIKYKEIDQLIIDLNKTNFYGSWRLPTIHELKKMPLPDSDYYQKEFFLSNDSNKNNNYGLWSQDKNLNDHKILTYRSDNDPSKSEIIPKSDLDTSYLRLVRSHFKIMRADIVDFVEEILNKTNNSLLEFKYGQFIFEEKKSKETISLGLNFIENAANKNHGEAQYYLGECYYNGLGVEKDVSTGFSWYKKASKNGHMDAPRKMALCIIKGEVSKQDSLSGINILNELIIKWDAKAKFSLGQIYFSGRSGITKNIEKGNQLMVDANDEGAGFEIEYYAIWTMHKGSQIVNSIINLFKG